MSKKWYIPAGLGVILIVAYIVLMVRREKRHTPLEESEHVA